MIDMELKEIKLWEQMAEIEVKQAKEFGRLSIMYLLACINNLRRTLSEENPFVLATTDIRYRTFVLKIVSEYKRQNLPDFENFVASVIMGKNIIN